MNVVRVENSVAPTRGRGGIRRRIGNFESIRNPVVIAHPKYDFVTEPRPLVNMAPVTSTSSMVTPKNPRRYQTTTSSSSYRKSALRRRAGQVSGGQISPHSNSSVCEHTIILAITSGRGDARGEVGIAAMDIYFPHMILCQISDSNTYINTLTKIHTLNPVEIIMPDTMCERSIYANGLYHAIKEKFGSVAITPIARMHFHDSSGLDRIRTHCSEESASVELVVKQKYYALAAASALFKYIEFIQHIIYAPKSMRIEFQGSENATMIDIESAQTLELVTSKGGIGKFSLLGSLDRCSTPMGRRLLRASILQPPCNLDVIKGRQACVAEFVSDRSFHSIVNAVVKRLYGASRLLTLAMLTSQVDSVQAAEKNLNYVLLLKNIIEIVPEFRSVMTNGQAPFFQKVFEDLKDERYQLIKEKILSVVHPDAKSTTGYTTSNLQRCFAIRSGLNDMLDIARQTYCELIDDMQKLVQHLSERYNLPLSLGCNNKLGYHIEMDLPRSRSIKIADLPEELIEVHKQKNTMLMTTEYLVVLSQHCRDACEELHIMSNVLLNEILSEVREHIGCLFKLSDIVGELDLLMSIAQVSSISDYTLPLFGKKLDLRDSRHPIMDISGMDCPVANDIIATPVHNFHTITGPNMSGKSVYLKQIVLLQIMAQIGSYVPATKAEFRICDRIFCSMCSRDEASVENTSIFVLEIKEARYILQSITPDSLVVLDELCHGTMVEEGTSIAWAICEKLLKTSAFVFNATHFLYLTRLTEFHYNVRNFFFETKSNVLEECSNDSRLVYTHKLKPGTIPVWNYGIALARSTGLPDTIVTMAQEIANDITKGIKPNDDDDVNDEDRSVEGIKKICYDCVAEMSKFLENDEFTVSNIVKLVNELKIPKVVRKMKIGEQLRKERELEESASLQRFSSKNFQTLMNDDRQLSKRLSTTSISSDESVKKSRFSSQREIPNASRPSLDYLGQERAKRSRQSFGIPVKILQLPSDDLGHIGQINKQLTTSFYSPNGSEILKNSTNKRNLMQNDGDKDSASFVTISSQGTLMQPDTSRHNLSEFLSGMSDSQSSVPTFIAEKTAREKEAGIFKMIQGNAFDEADLLYSCRSDSHSSDKDDD